MAGAGFWFLDSQARPELQQESAAQLTADLVESVYYASQLTDADQYADAIVTICEPDLAESIFVDSVAGRTERDAAGQVIGIRHVQLETKTVTLAKDDTNSFSAGCQWTVTAEVTHWGHSHLRSATYSGDLLIRHSPTGWRIARVEVSSAAVTNVGNAISGETEVRSDTAALSE
ncbi:MAG: hypothetical protein KDA85_04235 [Planctomycetaceae bacterium]|nr:hypothetical protein [Planctomycetaceae bacterium]